MRHQPTVHIEPKASSTKDPESPFNLALLARRFGFNPDHVENADYEKFFPHNFEIIFKKEYESEAKKLYEILTNYKIGCWNFSPYCVTINRYTEESLLAVIADDALTAAPIKKPSITSVTGCKSTVFVSGYGETIPSLDERAFGREDALVKYSALARKSSNDVDFIKYLICCFIVIAFEAASFLPSREIVKSNRTTRQDYIPRSNFIVIDHFLQVLEILQVIPRAHKIFSAITDWENFYSDLSQIDRSHIDKFVYFVHEMKDESEINSPFNSHYRITVAEAHHGLHRNPYIGKSISPSTLSR